MLGFFSELISSSEHIFFRGFVNDICQTLHFIHRQSEAHFGRKHHLLVQKRSDLGVFSLFGSSLVIDNDISPSASAQRLYPWSPVFFTSSHQWVWAHRDWGRVIVTVPALGCPRVSRWDLTRHGLSSLPYSPDTGAKWAGVLWGEGTHWLWKFSLFHPKFVEMKMACPLSNRESTLLQYCSKSHYGSLFLK